jgi:hypothetical protein
MKNKMRNCLAGVMMLVSATAALADASCIAGVQSALDTQRQQYISGQQAMASQGFSKRPGSFAETTCLDTLMQTGGLDILFKPPSLDNILGMVKNLACQQASQIFAKLTGGGGGGLSGLTNLASGEISSGINLGSVLSTIVGSSTKSNSGFSTSNINTSLTKLFQ